MAIPHAVPGEVIDVRPLGAALATIKTGTLLKAKNIEVVRLVMVAGKEIADHKAPGAITVHCLEGKVAFTALGQTHELTAGQMLYLNAGEPHSVKCIEDASFLLTILLHS
jgi:quercetin dioxygenase-like cupin family protein